MVAWLDILGSKGGVGTAVRREGVVGGRERIVGWREGAAGGRRREEQWMLSGRLFEIETFGDAGLKFEFPGQDADVLPAEGQLEPVAELVVQGFEGGFGGALRGGKVVREAPLHNDGALSRLEQVERRRGWLGLRVFQVPVHVAFGRDGARGVGREQRVFVRESCGEDGRVRWREHSIQLAENLQRARRGPR